MTTTTGFTNEWGNVSGTGDNVNLTIRLPDSLLAVLPAAQRPPQISDGWKLGMAVVSGSVVPAIVRGQVQVRTDNKPAALRELVAAYESACWFNVPGLDRVRQAVRAALAEAGRTGREFEQMMSDENNDGSRMPRPANPAMAANRDALLSEFPRAALYVRAEAQLDRTHWSDNSGTGAAANECMRLLRAGASLEDAERSLGQRREVNVD